MSRELLVVQQTRKSFQTGKTKPLEYRIHQLKALLRFISERRKDIADAVRQDLGKSEYGTELFETLVLEGEIKLAIEKLPQWAAPRPVEKTLVTISDEVYVQPEPLGVVLIIGAWNYPWAVTLQPLVGAIAAGNAAVIKPSEVSSHSAKIMEELLPQYLDKDLYPVVTGGVLETQELLKHRFDHIFYTGSSAVGKMVMGAAARHLTPVTLELGGKSPCYIDKNCDITVACRRITWGKFVNCGQTCIAPDYVLCEPSIQSRVVEEIKKSIKEFYTDNPKSFEDYGRIVNQRHFKRVMALMEGSTVAVGGDSDESQCYIGPTVLKDVTGESKVMKEEIFGPLLPIITVSSVDEAIQFINEREKPLVVYVFSHDNKLIKRIIAETSSGALLANDCLVHFTVCTLPFGGVGESGMGCYHGKYSFDQLSHLRSCLIRKLNMEGLNSMRYPPHTAKKLSWARFFLLKQVNVGRLRRMAMLTVLIGLAAFVLKSLTCIGICHVGVCMERQVVQRAKEAFLSGRTRPLEFRLQQLYALKRMITEKETEISTAVKQDINRSQYDTPLVELIGIENEISLAIEKLAEWAAPRPVEKNLLTISDEAYIQPEPLGVVLIIGAWNYPWALNLLPLVGAIAAGNAAVVKPSELSEYSSLLLRALLPRYLDKDLYPVVTGGVSETQELLRIKFDHIFYTGSSTVGKLVMEAAARNLTPVTLELGGKSPCYIDKNCEIRVACRRITWGKFINCGQTCIAPDYILCEPCIQGRVVECIRQTLLEFYGADPKCSPDYGRIINQRHFNRVMGLMEGYTPVVGGQSDASQCYIAPTVLKDVPPHSRLMQEEIFGPLLPIVTVSDMDDAIRFINEREKPLALYIFCSDKKASKHMIAETSSGGVTVNDIMMHYTLCSLPFGGVGQSGMGRYHGKHTFDQLSHHKSCLVRSLGMESVNLARYPPQDRRRARRARMALKSPLIDMSKRTLVWAVVATIIGCGLLITLLVILLMAAGLNCTCWYWRGFYN
ncbi:hypothetical protein Q8A73_006363 [Channa argus]|nr:hypothetical protein Q8A73_006363 [Channa argus]